MNKKTKLTAVGGAAGPGILLLGISDSAGATRSRVEKELHKTFPLAANGRVQLIM